MVPPNQTDHCSHTCLMGGPNWVYYHASRLYLQRGKVMRGRYLGQVGRHKACVPMFGFELMSLFGTVLPRRWPLMPLVGTGPPMTYPRGELVRVAGRGSCMGS